MTYDIEHHTARIKDIRVHYRKAGQGSPVVLLHGWPQTSYAWRDVMAALAHKHTVIAPDMRGMGATSKAALGYDTNNVADDLRALLDAIGIEKIYLAGHDWGGAVAYAFAAQFPERVKRLSILEMVLPGFGLMEGAMSPQPHGNFLWHMGFQSVPDIPFALLQGREEKYLRWFFQFYAYNPCAFTQEDIAEYVKSMEDVGALRAGLEYYRSFFDSAAQNELHRKTLLEMPVSAWGGEACLGGLTHQCLQIAAKSVVGGVIPQCGHWVGEERPDFVATHLLEFFGAD
jgi:pimeloyl-ACP methyl ester carboxylesterase